MFGNAKEAPQNENTPFNPRSPYGISKLAGYHLTRNHESPRRGFEFVTRKISNAVAAIRLGLAKELRLGNLNAKREWGYAPEYVEALWLMLQQEEADDYVIATGETHSVREFVEVAFNYVGLDWREFVIVDERFYRPAKIYELRGDYSKAKKRFGWEQKTSFEELVKIMVEADLERLKRIKCEKDVNSLIYQI
jgi:GDPmannose 4,6-dehydratase